MQINNTCDLVSGGESGEEIFLVSKSKNQFFAGREMLLDLACFGIEIIILSISCSFYPQTVVKMPIQGSALELVSGVMGLLLSL